MTTTPPSVIIAKYLLDLGLVKATGTEWRYSVDNMPDDGDNFVSVYDTTAVVDGKVHTGETILHYGIQVAIRSTAHAKAWAKGIAIQNGLDAIAQSLVVIGSSNFRLSSFVLSIPLTKIGNEEKNRRLLFAINGIVTIKEV